LTEQNTLLTVERTAESDVRHRQVIVSIDEQPFATLLFGKSETKPIAPGHHTLKAYNTLVWKTVEFDVAEGEHAKFQVINRPGRWTYLLVTLLGVGPIYLTIERLKANP
jgi:hypothetical protein